MPIYEFKCTKCGKVFERIMPVYSYRNSGAICDCGDVALRQISAHRVRSFNPQFVEDIQDKPVYVRNKQELTDAVNKFNDSELASKQGKVRRYE